jgi:hypothetical protein
MLIDQYLKTHDFREYHQLKIRGTVDTVYPSMINTDISRSVIIRLLFRLKGIPGERGTLKEMHRMGFIKLDEITNQELLFGMITTSSTFSDCNPNISPAQFVSEKSPGLIKAVINFSAMQVAENETLISTETRVLCGDKKTKNKFKLYWFIISPFSRMIRRLMLAQIRDQYKA